MIVAFRPFQLSSRSGRKAKPPRFDVQFQTPPMPTQARPNKQTVADLISPSVMIRSRVGSPAIPPQSTPRVKYACGSESSGRMYLGSFPSLVRMLQDLSRDVP